MKRSTVEGHRKALLITEILMPGVQVNPVFVQFLVWWSGSVGGGGVVIGSVYPRVSLRLNIYVTGFPYEMCQFGQEAERDDCFISGWEYTCDE